MAREKTKAELEREQRIKSSVYERKLKNKNNKFIVVSVTVILLGYIFFLFSPKLFHEKPERFYTDIGTNIAFTGGSVTPNSWVLAEKNKMMQIEFTFKSNQTIAPEIEVNAATSYTDRTKPSSRLQSEVIYQDGNFYIANIYDIPDDYYCVSLRIKTTEDKTKPSTNGVIAGDGIGNEVVRQLSETEGSTEETKEITATAVMYTCCDAVETVQTLYRLDDYIYRIKRIQSNINIDYAAIDENDTASESLRGTNAELEIRNDELTAEMLYMTSSEKQVNQREIDSNTNKINDNVVKIAALDETNQSLLEEIKEYEEIIKRIAAENEGREYVAPTEPTEASTELFTDPTAPPTEPTERATERKSN